MHNLKGKNTIEAALILSREFVRRFGLGWGTQADIVKILMPRGKAGTWSVLDKNINMFCKQFYASWKADAQKLSFWDEARFALGSLPMKRDYKTSEDKEQYSNPQFIAQFFETCSLCWRSVLRKPLERKTPLCHLHDIPSATPEYRKRARTKPRVEAIKLELIKSLPPLFQLKKEMGEELNSYVEALCLNESGALPHLARYLLHSLDMPLGTGREIVNALEAPIYRKNLSPLVAEAWEFHLMDKGKHFKLNYIKILTAEAWLRAEAERKHGGKRK